MKAGGNIDFLEEGGLILGAFPDAVYQESWTRLGPGDILLFYTDGSVEAQDGTGDEFGRDRLIEHLKRVRQLPARQIRTALVDAVREFAGQTDLADDLTFIVVKSL